MYVVECGNGHFFDSDTYDVCPLCSASPASDEKGTAPSSKKKNGIGDVFKDVISKNKGKSSKTEGGNSLGTYDGATSNTGNNDLGSDTKGVFELTNEGAGDKDSEHTSDESNNLSEEIGKASAQSEGETQGYFASKINQEIKGDDVQAVGSDPVVGWLVAVSGQHLGQSFQISAGKNSIGRLNDNRIVLNYDNSVSREKHAIITYEPKKRKFYVQPGDSSGLTYLNGEYITGTKPINRHDIIEIGESKLILIPLCGEDFTWEDYITKE